MDGFLTLDGELIKLEVEQNINYHCIICKAEFYTRESRNEHLETHFIHRNCEHCHKAVIIIGDLEFELHRPSHCTKLTKDHCNETSEIETVHEFNDVEDDSIETDEINLENSPETKPNQSNTNETVETDSDVPLKVVKRESSRKKKSKSKLVPPKHVEIVSIEASARGSDSDSEFDAFKQIDADRRKRRRRYAKLPKTIPCTMCDTMFGSERTLKIHMNQVHGIKERHICPICSREFKIGGNLKQHIETHSDHKRFICNYCGKGFHLPYNLKEHMNSHTGARPYKCETCGKTFGRNTLKQSHMRVHTGEKPYRCDQDNCDRAYAYQTDLKRHKRSIHNIITKTFPCPICAKVFYENKFLTKHLNVHRS